MFLRMTVAVLAYVLSSVGILLMYQLIVEELRSSKGPNLLVFVWIAAWLIHVVMTVAWIRDRKLSRVWPVVGTVAGVSSFLVWALLAVKDAVVLGVDDTAVNTASAGTLTAIQAALVAPCILLAVWLVRFHCKAAKPIPLLPVISNGA